MSSFLPNCRKCGSFEELLDAARSGKLVSVAIAGIDDDGCIVTACSETDDFARILGAIARLTYRVNVIQDEVTS